MRASPAGASPHCREAGQGIGGTPGRQQTEHSLAPAPNPIPPLQDLWLCPQLAPGTSSLRAQCNHVGGRIGSIKAIWQQQPFVLDHPFLGSAVVLLALPTAEAGMPLYFISKH